MPAVSDGPRVARSAGRGVSPQIPNSRRKPLTRLRFAKPPAPARGEGKGDQLICPSGCFATPVSSAARKNILPFRTQIPLFRNINQFYIPSIPSHYEGRCATSTTRGGMRWTRRVLLTRAPEAYGEGVWSRHRDAGVSSWRQLRGDGGQRARAPRRARYKP
jgi:hypothetical protein